MLSALRKSEMQRKFRGSDYGAVLSELEHYEPNPDKLYTLEIKEQRKRRSLDANAYCWVLLGQLSKRLKIPSEELYKEYIRRIGKYTVMSMKSEAVETFEKGWQGCGLGWFIVHINDTDDKKFSFIKAYYGSSSYDTAEMSLLLDEIVSDCKEHGIETATGAELKRLKDEWS